MATKSATTRKRDPADVAACTFANLRKVTRAMAQVYDAALQPVGLRGTQFTLLATLDRRGDLPLTQLAEALVMDRTTLTRNLKPLTARGLIRVEPEEDRRVRRISLTASGKRVLEEALPLWDQAQSRIVQGLGTKRWSELLDGLSATLALVRDR